VQFASTCIVVPWRTAPSTIAATSLAVQEISWEWIAMLLRSTCQ
jgi:hypothetical protein